MFLVPVAKEDLTFLSVESLVLLYIKNAIELHKTFYNIKTNYLISKKIKSFYTVLPMYEDLPDEELFGPKDNSDTFSENESIDITSTTFPSISGLILYENLLTHEQQNNLINGIIEANYFDNPESNQAMCFGELPSFLLNIIEIISHIPGIFPDEILNRKPLFDQACV